MKKIIILTGLLSVLVVKLAYAVIPVIYVVASVIFHLTVAGLIWYGVSRSGNSSATSSNVTTPVVTQWIDLTDPTNPSLKTGTDTLTVTMPGLKSIVNSQQTTYPILTNILTSNGAIPSSQVPTGTALATNSVVNVNGTYYKITGTVAIGSLSGGSCYSSNPTYDSGLLIFEYSNTGVGDPNGCGSGMPSHKCSRDKYSVSIVSAPSQHSASDAEAAITFNSNPSSFSGDLDALLKSNPNICTFASPKTAPTSAQVAAAQAAAGQTGTGGNTPPVPTTPGGTGGTTGGISGNTPGTPGTISPGSGNGASGGLPDDPANYPVPGIQKYGDNRPNDFNGRFSQFLTDMRASPLLTFANNAAGSIPSTGSSTYTFNGGRFGSHTMDYSTLSPVFSFLSKMFMILTVFSSVRIITKAGAQ